MTKMLKFYQSNLAFQHSANIVNQKKRFKIFTLFLLILAKARAPSPPHASIGRITLSTSLASLQPFSKEALFLTKYCGALLSPASTHGKNVCPNFFFITSKKTIYLSTKIGEAHVHKKIQKRAPSYIL